MTGGVHRAVVGSAEGTWRWRRRKGRRVGSLSCVRREGARAAGCIMYVWLFLPYNLLLWEETRSWLSIGGCFRSNLEHRNARFRKISVLV